MMSGKAAAEASGDECCMCGDHGLSHELFSCKVCQFRSQHRYCSSQYPKADSYRVCDWCLHSQKEETAEKSQTSSHSLSHRIRKDHHLIKKEKKSDGNEKPIKKKPGIPPPAAGGGGGVAEKRQMRRRKESEMDDKSKGASGTTTKLVLRNKVIRRYKLLEEVSS
ncbi:hypothetical protein NMG60_11016724 [Bertholletia excelsa]